MNILKVLNLLRANGYKPGRLQRTYKNYTAAKISNAMEPLTALKAAWLIYLYAVSPQDLESAREWILSHQRHYKEIEDKGEETPVQYIARLLRDPEALSNIVAIGIDRKTKLVMSINDEGVFYMPTNLSLRKTHKSDEPDMVFFGGKILAEIALMIIESTQHYSDLLSNK